MNNSTQEEDASSLLQVALATTASSLSSSVHNAHNAHALDTLQQSTPLRYRCSAVNSRVSSVNHTPHTSSLASTPRHSLAASASAASKLSLSSSADAIAAIKQLSNSSQSHRHIHRHVDTHVHYDSSMRLHSALPLPVLMSSPLTMSQRDLLDDSAATHHHHQHINTNASVDTSSHTAAPVIENIEKIDMNTSNVSSASTFGTTLIADAIPSTVKKLKLLHDKQHIMARTYRIQRTMIQLSNYLIIVLLSVVTWYIYTMISPVLSSLIYAAVAANALSTLQVKALYIFQCIDHYYSTARIHNKALILLVCITVYLSIIYSIYDDLNHITSTAVLLLLSIIMRYANRHTLTAVLLIVTLITCIAIPVLLIINTVTHETHLLIARINSFVTENYQFDDLLTHIIQHPIYQYVAQHGTVYDIHAPSFNAIKLYIIQIISRMTTMTSNYMVTYAVSSNILLHGSYFSLQIMVFFSSLYYLLQHQCVSSPSSSVTSSSFQHHILELSPFSSDDNQKIESMKRSLYRTILASLSIGASHTVITYISLYAVGSNVCLILSLMAGLLSMMPVVSSWLVVLPIIVQLYVTSYIYSACFILLVQSFVLLYVDPLIYRIIPGNVYVTSLSLLCGIYTFGVTGILYGPTLAAVALTLIDIYKEYNSVPTSSLQNVNTLWQPIINAAMPFSSPVTSTMNINTPFASDKTMTRQDTPFQLKSPTTTTNSEEHEASAHPSSLSSSSIGISAFKHPKTDRKRKLVMSSQRSKLHESIGTVHVNTPHHPHSDVNFHDDILEQSDTSVLEAAVEAPSQHEYDAAGDVADDESESSINHGNDGRKYDGECAMSFAAETSIVA
jgi:predicted PurR-regulated permease PerM